MSMVCCLAAMHFAMGMNMPPLGVVAMLDMSPLMHPGMAAMLQVVVSALAAMGDVVAMRRLAAVSG